jgi:hypothetical protein
MRERLVVFILAVVGIVLAFYFNNLMPSVVATHFDINGMPNGWMRRESLVYFSVGIYLVLAASFTLIPVRCMNFPNKDHWLAPERIAQTEAAILKTYTRFGAATEIFIIAMMVLVYRANMSAQVHFDKTVWVLILVYFVYSILWSFQFRSRFKKV